MPLLAIASEVSHMARTHSQSLDPWQLVWGQPYIDSDTLAAAIESDLQRHPQPDYRTRLLVRDAVEAIRSFWDPTKFKRWLAASPVRDRLRAILSESFDETGTPIDPRQTTPAVFEPPLDDLESQASAAFNVSPEQFRSDVCAKRVDIVQKQIFELRALDHQARQDAVAEQVRDFIPMPNRVQTLKRQVVSVIADLPGIPRPADKGLPQTVSNLLLLFVQNLLRHFLPGEPEVANSGN